MSFACEHVASFAATTASNQSSIATGDVHGNNGATLQHSDLVSKRTSRERDTVLSAEL